MHITLNLNVNLLTNNCASTHSLLRTHRWTERISEGGIWLCCQWNGPTYGRMGPEGKQINSTESDICLYIKLHLIECILAQYVESLTICTRIGNLSCGGHEESCPAGLWWDLCEPWCWGLWTLQAWHLNHFWSFIHRVCQHYCLHQHSQVSLSCHLQISNNTHIQSSQ